MSGGLPLLPPTLYLHNMDRDNFSFFFHVKANVGNLKYENHPVSAGQRSSYCLSCKLYEVWLKRRYFILKQVIYIYMVITAF